jgi:hypothetical protein
MEESDDVFDGPLEERLPFAFREARKGLPEERLQACDGLNNYHVYLARLDIEPQGDARYTFTVTHSMTPAGEFTVSVKGGGRSMNEMAVDAHDALINIFRQLMFRADKARQQHARNAARPAADAVDAEALGGLESKAGES